MKPLRTEAKSWRSLPKAALKSNQAVYSRVLREHIFAFNEEEFRELLLSELLIKAEKDESSVTKSELEDHANGPMLFLAEVYQFVLCKQSSPPKFNITAFLADYLAEDIEFPAGALELEQQVNDWLLSQPEETWTVTPTDIAWNGEFVTGDTQNGS